MKISDNTAISMPMRNLISIVIAVAIGVWAYFGVIETLNKHSTTLELMSKDLEANSEFRIKYPRGELGQSSGEAELFMLVEHMAGLIEGMEEELKNMRNNKNEFWSFDFPPCVAPVGGYRGPVPGKSSPPYDSLYFGCGELDFGDFYLTFGRNCKISFFETIFQP